MSQDHSLTDLDFFVSGNPDQIWRELRANDPIHWTERNGKTGFWSITKHEDALSVYRDPLTFSSERGISIGFTDPQDPNLPAMQFGFGKMMIMTDPPRHGRMRQ